MLSTRLKAWWLFMIGLGLQVLCAFYDFPADIAHTWGFAIYMASFALILGALVVNFNIKGMPILFLGIALNTLVIGLNQGMPVTPPAGETVSPSARVS